MFDWIDGKLKLDEMKICVEQLTILCSGVLVSVQAYLEER